MLKWVEKNKKSSIVIIIFVFMFILIIVPLIINTIYYLEAPHRVFNVGYDISSILSYYGSILSFIGTLSLGITTVYQNYISQKKTDEVNRLTLELQKKSMLIASQNYDREKEYQNEQNTPRFQVENKSMNGNYMNLVAILSNISNVMVSNIKSISFEALDKDNTITSTSDNVRIKLNLLAPHNKTEVEFNNSEISLKTPINSSYWNNNYEGLKNITLVWDFQCEDIIGNIHYYKAKLSIKDSKQYVKDSWNVNKVG